MYVEVLPIRMFRKSPNFEDGILTYSYDKAKLLRIENAPVNTDESNSTAVHPDLAPDHLAIGTIVEIPLGRSTAIGVVYRTISAKSLPFKVKPILGIRYKKPLPEYLVKSAVWLSSYYLSPLPQVMSLFLPSGIAKQRREKAKALPASADLIDTEIPLNPAQKQAIKELAACKPHTKLLHGITGSGKTNIYLSLAKDQFKADRSTILLVPEIALTSQLVQVFQQTFGSSVTLIHSKQTEAERHLTWEDLLNSDAPRIVIGPRSALFAPLHDLGLIIIDEAHEPTYFQEQPPKYSALRLASFIANAQNIDCIQGTATPLISDYFLAQKNHSCVELKTKAKETATKPDVRIVDFKDRAAFSTSRYFSAPLLSQIKQNLEHHEQTLIFHNRRGSAPLTICENCGWQALCPNCFLPLTLHADEFKLVCHTCGHEEKVPTRCPECGHTEIIHKGFGTKLLETELTHLFKNARIARFDSDNEKNSSLASLYQDVKDGKIDIIIGTQTIARGLDLPHLATVGIVQADAGLSLPDYAAEERTFHLLTQVLGRVGRGHIEDANAVIQTYQPDHPVISCAIDSDYDRFYEYLIRRRQKSKMPPYYFLAQLYFTFKTERTALKKIRETHRALSLNQDLIVSAPLPAFHERTRSGYTWQLIIRSKNRKTLVEAIKALPTYAELRFTIDPPSLLQ